MADTTPPELFGLTYSPTAVNTSTGPQVVTVTLSVSDPDSGVSDAQLRFRSPSGNQLADVWFDATHRIAGDEFKGEYQNSVTIPHFAEQGAWSIDYVLLRDQATNFQRLHT